MAERGALEDHSIETSLYKCVMNPPPPLFEAGGCEAIGIRFGIRVAYAQHAPRLAGRTPVRGGFRAFREVFISLYIYKRRYRFTNKVWYLSVMHVFCNGGFSHFDMKKQKNQ